MTFQIVTVYATGPTLSFPGGEEFKTFDNRRNEFSPAEAYQKLLEECPADVIIYAHSDLTVHDPEWLGRLMALFAREECVAAGFGGATALGNLDLYRKKYNIWNLARRGYGSNQTDAEVHGERFTGDRRVAVLDAFLMAVRCAWLRDLGGWPSDNIGHHCLDLWLACEAARRGKEIWTAGVDCTHHGGGASTTDSYARAKWLRGQTLEEDHQRPHRWLANSFRDVLPIEVES